MPKQRVTGEVYVDVQGRLLVHADAGEAFDMVGQSFAPGQRVAFAVELETRPQTPAEVARDVYRQTGDFDRVAAAVLKAAAAQGVES